MTSRITSGQAAQITTFAEAAVRKVVQEALASMNLASEEAQRVIEHGGDFQDFFKQPAIAALKALYLSDQFADEQVESHYGYLSGYKPNGIVAQINKLRELFPGIGSANQDMLMQVEKGKVELSAGTDENGFFAIPHWSKVASTYGEAVAKVLDLLRQSRNGAFCDYLEGHFGPEYLRESERKARMMNELLAKQGADILIVQAQFGIRHRGRSVRRARAVMVTHEFGLGLYEIVVMLLTHPERLQHYDDLWIDAAGDEYSPDADGDFELALCVGFDGDDVELDYCWVARTDRGCGSASAFVAQ